MARRRRFFWGCSLKKKHHRLTKILDSRAVWEQGFGTERARLAGEGLRTERARLAQGGYRGEGFGTERARLAQGGYRG